MKKIKKVKVPILNNEYFVYVLWGNKVRVIKWINSYFGEKYHYSFIDDCRGKTFYQHGYYPVIFINTQIHFFATLAHEAVHALNYIWEDIAEESKNEIYAHSVGAIIRIVKKQL